MTVYLRLHGQLAALHQRVKLIEARGGKTLLEMLGDMSLEGGTYSVLQVNGQIVDGQAVPKDGDVVDVYPPIGGG